MIYLSQNIERIAAKVAHYEGRLPETTGKQRKRMRRIISGHNKTLRHLLKLQQCGVLFNKNNARKTAVNAA